MRQTLPVGHLLFTFLCFSPAVNHRTTTAAAVAGLAATLAACSSGKAAAPATPSASPSTVPSPVPARPTGTLLDQLSLPEGQYGSLVYLRRDRPDSTSLSTPTLGLCGADFAASEKLRLHRLQFDLVATDGTGLSNDLTEYEPGGASAALAALERVSRSCLNRDVRTTDPALKRLVVTLTPIQLTGLVDQSLALKATIVSTPKQGTPRTTQTIYVFQFKGEVLDELFTVGTDLAAQTALAQQAAADLAGQLTSTPGA